MSANSDIAGRASRLGDAEARHARALLAGRYSFLSLLSAGPAALLAAWRNAAFYRIEPSRITLITSLMGVAPAGMIGNNACGMVVPSSCSVQEI